MEDTYQKAYTEVLAILKCLSKPEYNKIAEEKIKFLEENCDKQYNFSINPKIPLEEQQISKKANAILVTIYRDFFATEEQKNKMNVILKSNYLESEKQKQEKYNLDDLFKGRDKKEIVTIKDESLVVYKKNIILRIIDKIKGIFRRQR